MKLEKKINDVDVYSPDATGRSTLPFLMWYSVLGGYSHLFFISIVCCVLFTVDYTHIMMSSQKKIIRV